MTFITLRVSGLQPRPATVRFGMTVAAHYKQSFSTPWTYNPEGPCPDEVDNVSLKHKQNRLLVLGHHYGEDESGKPMSGAAMLQVLIQVEDKWQQQRVEQYHQLSAHYQKELAHFDKVSWKSLKPVYRLLKLAPKPPSESLLTVPYYDIQQKIARVMRFHHEHYSYSFLNWFDTFTELGLLLSGGEGIGKVSPAGRELVKRFTSLEG